MRNECIVDNVCFMPMYLMHFGALEQQGCMGIDAIDIWKVPKHLVVDIDMLTRQSGNGRDPFTHMHKCNMPWCCGPKLVHGEWINQLTPLCLHETTLTLKCLPVGYPKNNLRNPYVNTKTWAILIAISNKRFNSNHVDVKTTSMERGWIHVSHLHISILNLEPWCNIKKGSKSCQWIALIL